MLDVRLLLGRESGRPVQHPVRHAELPDVVQQPGAAEPPRLRGPTRTLPAIPRAYSATLRSDGTCT